MSDAVTDRVNDLVVLSHLRWPWVWQRPQHLVSRLARRRAAAGGRTWFIEEPTTGDVSEPQLGHEQRDGITRVWLVVPPGKRAAEVHGFDADGGEDYGELLAGLLAEHAARPARTCGSTPPQRWRSPSGCTRAGWPTT